MVSLLSLDEREIFIREFHLIFWVFYGFVVEKWKKHRRLLTPAFNLRMLDTFFSIFNAKSERLVGKLKKEVDTGEYFDLWPYISTMALDLICRKYNFKFSLRE